jgi:hypothetical protein
MFFNAEISEFDSKLEENLEPRLIEYLKKKQYYKNNNIEGSLLEKEFSIDKKDIAKIKNYLQGKKLKKNNHNSDMVAPSTASFPSESLHDDPRLKKIEKKQQRDREAREQKDNHDIMARGYDMYRDDRKFASAYGDDFKSRFNPQVWLNDDFYRHKNPPAYHSKKSEQDNYRMSRTRNDDNFNEDSDDERNGYNFANNNPNLAMVPTQEQILNKRRRNTNPNIYKHKKPAISYKRYIPYGENNDLAGQNYSLDNIIGKLDTYRDDLTNYHREDEMDLDTKVSVPGGKCNNKREKENNYRAVPYMTGTKARDVDIENYLCYGNGPSRGAKSLGYPNPAEHYFQYISNDVQKPEHTVFEPGMPTRMMNKDTARPYKTRDVM